MTGNTNPNHIGIEGDYEIAPHGNSEWYNSVIVGRTSLLSVVDLMGENPKRRKTRVNLQLLKILSKKSNESATKFQWYKKKGGNQYNNSSGMYERMYMFRDLESKDGKVVQIIQQGPRNKEIWGNESSVRDNGILGVGSCVFITDMKPVTDYLAGDIPIIDTEFSANMLKNPKFKPVPMDTKIENDVTRSFVLREAKVTVHSVAPIKTNCGGLLCKKTYAKEVQRSKRGCGCFETQDRIASVALVYCVEIENSKTGYTFEDKEFSHSSFDQLFMKDVMPSAAKRRKLDNTKEFVDFEDSMDKILTKYNNKKKFTVIGWYKRGEIKDKSTDSETKDVESGEISFHVVTIVPEDTEEEAAVTDDDKFDPKRIA